MWKVFGLHHHYLRHFTAYLIITDTSPPISSSLENTMIMLFYSLTLCIMTSGIVHNITLSIFGWFPYLSCYQFGNIINGNTIIHWALLYYTVHHNDVVHAHCHVTFKKFVTLFFTQMTRMIPSNLIHWQESVTTLKYTVQFNINQYEM